MEHDQTEQNISQDPDTGESLPSEASAPPRSASGDVLSLIEDVERHLTRIRDVQSRQETEFEDLAERQRRVDDAEKAFESRRCEVEEAAAAVESARASLSEEQVEINGLRTTLEDREAQCSESADTIENSKRDLEAARAEVATDRSALEVLVAEIADRERTVMEERGALDALRDEIEIRENAFVDRSAAADAAIARINELEEAYRQLTESFETQGAAHQQAMNTAEETIERHRSALESVGGDLESAQAELGASRGELESLRMLGAAAETDKEQLLEMVSLLEARCTELDAANASSEASLGEATSRTVEIESGFATARAKVETLESTIAEDQRQLQLAGEKLTELAQAISEQAPRLERGTAAIALLAQQQETISKLESRLTDDGADATNAVARIRDTLEAKIAELDSALERARAEGADPESLGAAIAAARAPLEARIHELESGGGFDASAVEGAIREATAPLLEEIGRLQNDAESSDGPSVTRERHETVKERCRRAERRSDELETALSMTNDKGQAQEMAKRLRAKAERVGEAARHLELRKSRLIAVRKAVRSKGEGSGSNPSFQELQRIESQRKELSQVREFLSRSEQQMIRRWARSRSMTTVGWVMILAVLCSVGSWFGVQELVPISGAASVELRATPRDGDTLSPFQVRVMDRMA